MNKKQNKVKLKKGMKVCHIDYPKIRFHGTLEEDVKRGYPAIIRVELKSKYHNNFAVISYRASKLRECNRNDLLIMAIEKMKRNDNRING
jgi:hypothetical protein